MKIVKDGIFICYVDGASRGNPGPCGIGIVIKDKSENTICEIKEYIGEGTNNIAEYCGVKRALEELKKLKAKNVVLNIDSNLVVNQLKGIYRVKDKNLKSIFMQIKKLEEGFLSLEYNFITRDKNKTADKLANIALNLKGF